MSADTETSPNLQSISGDIPGDNTHHYYRTTPSTLAAKVLIRQHQKGVNQPRVHVSAPFRGSKMSSRSPSTSPPTDDGAGMLQPPQTSPRMNISTLLRRKQYTIDLHDKLLITIVGLPARGKSYTAKKLMAYLTWLGFKVKLFNFEEKRIPTPTKRRNSRTLESEPTMSRSLPDTSKFPILPRVAVMDPYRNPVEPDIQVVTAEDDTNAKVMKILVQQFLEFFRTEGGEIALFIPWSTTHKKRCNLLSKCQQSGLNLNVLFVENICNDISILKQNLQNKIDNSPYLKNMPPSEATRYLHQRILKYQRSFETISDDNMSYIKMINLSSKIISNRIFGHLSTTVMNFLTSIHLELRPVWLATEVVVEEGGKVEATDERFRVMLGKFVEKRIPNKMDELVIFTSPESIKTVQHLYYGKRVPSSLLDPLNTGECMNLSDTEIMEQKPEIYQKLKSDQFHYRFPNGESYSDLVQRLDPFILQLERFTVPTLVVAHQSVIKVLYCYFMKSQQVLSVSDIEIPKYTVIELASTQVGWTERAYSLVKTQ